MATWPTSSLGIPSTDGYTIDPLDQSVRTDMEAGNPRTRRRTFARVNLLNVSIGFNDAQFHVFRDWFEDGTNGAAGGAGWFTMGLATGTGSISNISARFVGPFRARLLPALNWVVEAKLETRD